MSGASGRVDSLFDDVDLERAWAGTVVALALALVVGAAAFPQRVYDRFLWQYFWGPVVADGRGAECAVRSGGTTEIVHDASACTTAAGVVAYPGYTVVSTVSYALVLVLLLAGVYFLLVRLGIGDRHTFLYPLFPWVVFGGALRTLEDASIAFLEAPGVDPLFPFPWTAAIISPFIYVTVFALTVLALLGSFQLRDRGVTDTWEGPLAAIGSTLALGTVGYLFALALTAEPVSLNLGFFAVVLGGALAVTAGTWVATERYWPVVNEGTGYVGALVVFGHTVDGIANWLSLDHAAAFGLPTGYEPKHVVNSAIRDVTAAIQPGWLTEAIGATWPFLLVKVAAATLVVWLFNDEMLEESPRYSVLLLLAVLAVGLGPGSRDVLRATFGI